ncbi:hypothetical protein FS749_013571 [Ceratobasidium sp. UAMH 11750]|nr:hypothetical protein FS749_013571 [Ceratobasidium sp. UAMH 11750]
MSVEKKREWEAFDECVSLDLRAKWATLDTGPKLQRGKWTSVYLAETQPAISVTQSLAKLKELELASSEARSTSNSGGQSSTASNWILDGIEIETLQHKLKRQITQFDLSPTPAQALETTRQRQAIQQKITAHVQDASRFLSDEQLNLYVLSDESVGKPSVPGKPETAKLALPSRLPRFCGSGSPRNNQALIARELSCRQNKCLQSLARVRTTSQQKALLLQQKEKNIRGEVHNTRVRSMVARLTARVDEAVWEYRNSRATLCILGATQDELEWLQPLEDKHLSGLTSMLQADRSTGEGKRKLPWFWSVRSMDIGNTDDSAAENDEAMKVEWFRGQARYQRWEEEVMILRREMASVLFSFHAEEEKWAERERTMEASFDRSYQSFCCQEMDMWRGLRRDAASKFRPFILGHETQDPTCRRAADLFLSQ